MPPVKWHGVAVPCGTTVPPWHGQAVPHGMPVSPPLVRRKLGFLFKLRSGVRLGGRSGGRTRVCSSDSLAISRLV